MKRQKPGQIPKSQLIVILVKWEENIIVVENATEATVKALISQASLAYGRLEFNRINGHPAISCAKIVRKKKARGGVEKGDEILFKGVIAYVKNALRPFMAE